jgi:hypothetical protein
MPFAGTPLKSNQIQKYDAAGALSTIKKSARSNESGAGFPVVDISIPATAPAGEYFGAGAAVALHTPGRTVLAPVAPPFDVAKRAFAIVLHHDLPPLVRLLLARENGFSALAAAAADPFNSVGLNYAAATPEAWANAARIHPMEPFSLFETASPTELVGPLHFQLTRTAVTTAYDPTLDVGNAGRAIVGICTPIADGFMSGRAPEQAIEWAGDGPAYVLIRPVFNSALAPDQPYLDNNGVYPIQTYPSGVDDKVTPSWRQFGSLMGAREFNRLIEYAEVMKNFNNDVVDRTISQHRFELNVQVSSKNAFVLASMAGGKITQANAYFKAVDYTPFLDRFEMLVVAVNSKGAMRCIYCPDVNLTPNGAEALGARGETSIPVQLKGNTVPRDYFSDALYQMDQFIIQCTLT